MPKVKRSPVGKRSAGVREAYLETLPVILTLDELAPIYRLSQSTIRRQLQQGTFAPRPWDKYPYRWRRDDVLADLKRVRPPQPRRPHGFAAVGKPRPARATLPPLPAASRRSR
jgi:hypothetical protein